MLTPGKREVMCQAVEGQGEGKELHYERWENVASALFVPLAIVRALSEGSFTKEERARVVDAVETELRSLDELFPVEEQEKYKNALAQLRASNLANENFLRDALGERIRFAMRQVEKTAPLKPFRDEEDEKRRSRGDVVSPSHLWLEGFEAKEISNQITKLFNQETEGKMDEIAVFSTIGHLQRLLMIVERLRDRIDEEEIDVGTSYVITPSGIEYLEKRDADECVRQITNARDSLIKSLLPVTDESRSSTPYHDINLIDKEALDSASDIAGWLSVVKARSV